MPDSSQYTAIVRTKSALSGKSYSNPAKQNVPYIYGGYFPLYRVLPNALLSNKFIPEPPVERINTADAVWATYLDGSGSDIGYGVAIDLDGNVYITGRYINTPAQIKVKNANGNGQIDSLIELPNTSNYAVFLIKYNSSGIAQWATYLDGSGQDVAYAITTDNSGNIYITGQYFNPTTQVTLKNANGNTQTDSLIKLDTAASSAMFLIKYNPSGIAQWATYLNGSSTEIGYAITADTSNNIYITGVYNDLAQVKVKNANGNGQIDSGITLDPTTVSAVFLIKYNSSGIAQLATCFDGALADVGRGIAMDTNENVYITGNYVSTDPVIIKSANGTGQINSGITLDPTTNNAVFLIKYNSSGIAQWATYLDGSGIDNGFGVATDKNNNIYITGQCFTNFAEVTIKNANGNGQTNSGIAIKGMTTGYGGFLVKYNSSGIVQWATYLDAFATGNYLAIDKNNDVYMTGFYGGAITIKNANGNGQINSSIKLVTLTNAVFIVKYNSSGIAQWATYLDGSGSTDIGYAIVADSSNNIYITGTYISSRQDKLKNAYGTGQRDSDITLVPTTNTAVFLIKYSQS
jgi:hypothetical protein